MRLEALWELFMTRVRVFLREPEAVFWTFGFPILIAIALGIAFRSRTPEKVHVGVLDNGQAAVELALAFAASPDLDAELLGEKSARNALRTGKVALVVVPGSPIALRFDPTRDESRTARLAVQDALDVVNGRAPAIAAREEPVTEKGSRYIDFLIPGLLGMNIMSASMWGIGYSIVETRSRKLLKRMAATPMPRAHYLLAFILGHLVLVTGLFVTLVGFARFVFGVEVFGSVPALFAVAIAGAMSFAGLGLLVASRTEKVEVLSGLNNLVMLPMFIASGVFFTSETFPDVVQPAIQALPLTAMNDALRAVWIDGRPLPAVANELAILAGWGVASFFAALRAFRWK